MAIPFISAVYWSLLWFCFGHGMLAMVKPKWFVWLCERSSRWINSGWCLPLIDRPYDIDEPVLRHTRIFGGAILGSSMFLMNVAIVS